MPSARRNLALACLFAASLGVPRKAEANGRFPRAERLIERGGDPDKLVLSATYGLLVTDDRGGTWHHLCELGFAFTIDQIDPLFDFFPDGSMVVKGSRSLNRAPPPFCAFEPVLGGRGTDLVVDFSLDENAPNRMLALFMERVDGGSVANRLYESVDEGRTFAPFGTPLPEADIAFGITLDIAPSDSRRLYATATGRDVAGVFARSDDAGETWSTSVLALGDEEYPYLAAVGAEDADIVYVRTDFWTPNAEGIYEANDGLLYSDDGGASFREIHRAPGKLFGFALSPDGTEVLVGYGDPVEPSRAVDAAALGIYRASTADHVFTKIYDGAVSCLAWTENGLYVCTSEDEREFALGFSPNANFELDTAGPLTPLLELPNVSPLECPSCSSGAACLAAWETSCLTFRNCDAGLARGGSGGTDCTDAGAGAGGASGSDSGGALGASGASGDAAKKSSPARDSACGCRVGQAGSGALVSLGCLGLALVLLVRRRPAPGPARGGSRLRDQRETTIKVRRGRPDPTP